MRKVVEARLVNPNRAPRILVQVDSPANRYNDYGESELPEGAAAKLFRDEATVCLPRRCGRSGSSHLGSFRLQKRISRPPEPRSSGRGEEAAL